MSTTLTHARSRSAALSIAVDRCGLHFLASSPSPPRVSSLSVRKPSFLADLFINVQHHQSGGILPPCHRRVKFSELLYAVSLEVQ